jgi:L-lactate dehydrogenase (cytochrome)
VSLSVPFATSIEDLRCQARRRIPRMFYDYVDAGSWTEGTYRANTERLRDIHLRQRVAVNVDGRHVRSTMLGQPVAMPVALGPAGLAGLLHPDGEIHAACAAEAFGVPFALSTMSICSIEDVAAATTRPFWFQLYLLRDRGFSASLIERAKAARCSALILTLDTPVLGRRHKDARNGLSTAPQWYRPRVLMDFVRHPRWCMDMLKTRRRVFGNIVGHAPGADNLTSMSDWKHLEIDSSLTWEDIEWVRRQWGGPLILKGLMDPADARRAAQMDVAAIVVSNHGGRQLDGIPATIDTLAHMVEAVRAVPGASTEVWMDSGLRSGQDVLKALALGAQATLIGRAYLYGLAAQGRAGVTRCLEILSEELELSMAMCGHVRVGTLDRSVLVASSGPA